MICESYFRNFIDDLKALCLQIVYSTHEANPTQQSLWDRRGDILGAWLLNAWRQEGSPDAIQVKPSKSTQQNNKPSSISLINKGIS
jgi:hypothetical protein